MRLRALIVLLLSGFIATALAAEEQKITFKKNQIDAAFRDEDAAFRDEGVAVGDYNRDGKMDIATGSVWHAAPDWKMHALTEEAKGYTPKRYSECFNAWADDLNADGWPDSIEITWPGKEAVWFAPQGKDEPWKGVHFFQQVRQ